MRINRLLVIASVIYVIPGAVLLFASDVLLSRGGQSSASTAQWLAGELGAALVAFALLNWFQRYSLLGGIYGRPLLLANLLLLSNATFSSIGRWRAHGDTVFAITGAIAGALLFAFARKLFGSPDLSDSSGSRT